MAKYRFWAIIILAAALASGIFIYRSEKDGSNKFKLGLDLSGGAHLVYRADLSGVASGEENEAMQALRDAIENRINIFGVSEPLVQVERGGLLGGGSDYRLIVELP